MTLYTTLCETNRCADVRELHPRETRHLEERMFRGLLSESATSSDSPSTFYYNNTVESPCELVHSLVQILGSQNVRAPATPSAILRSPREPPRQNRVVVAF